MRLARHAARRLGVSFSLRWMLPLVVVSSIAGCGKKGPPLPPLRNFPERVAHASIRQIGDRIVLSFPKPVSRTDHTLLGAGASVEILMSTRDPAPRRAGEIELNPDLTWHIPHSDWDAYAQGRRMDVGISLERIAAGLELPQGAAALKGRKLSFVVEAVEGNNKRSIPSDIETFAVCEPPPTPVGSAARIIEEGLLLSWSAGGPAQGARFNVYRQDEDVARPDTPIHPPLLDAVSYLDATALLGKAYRYSVRAAAASGRCESADSPVVTATRVDLFPPSPPQGLAAVAEKGTIRLFWRPNREPDLHGYRVYRADGPGGAWRVLTPDDLTATSYTDEDVAAGVVYSYAVTARDAASPPNESLYSDPAVEKTEPGK